VIQSAYIPYKNTKAVAGAGETLTPRSVPRPRLRATTPLPLLAESPRFRGRAAVRSALADKLLEAKIASAFAEHISASMAPLGVSVSVANGKITLGGMSCSGALRQRAETIAHTVARASPIDNRIVSVPSHGRF
jgi:hypothetical protein